jgi:hypothetical protein
MKRIILEIKKPDEMRYKTVGDWYDGLEREGTIFISAVDTGQKSYNAALLIHELIEYLLCERLGITTEDVDKWDFAHENSDDPGILDGCPYREPHISATIAEDVVLALFGANPYDYDKAIEKVYLVVERAINRKRREEK